MRSLPHKTKIDPNEEFSEQQAARALALSFKIIGILIDEGAVNVDLKDTQWWGHFYHWVSIVASNVRDFM